MRGIKRDGERGSIDPPPLRHLPSEGVWTFEHHRCEFVVSGGTDGPQPARHRLALFVAAHLSEFVTEANDYLASFVVPERVDASGPWEVQTIEFGRNAVDPLDALEVQLVLDGDTYGLWGVQFRYSDHPLDRFFPVQFSRKQR